MTGSTLIIMRHAKSSWADPGLPDKARPLNARGRAAAGALGTWLRAGGYLPNVVLCSSAVRTRETCALLGLVAPASFRDDLYLTGSQTYLAAARGVQAETLLVVGHNPGIADLAATIVARAPDHPRFHDYPTGATLVARCDEGFAQLSAGSATPLAFTVPRDLTDG